jgi:REP element-mobilizing transposase RayT
MVFATPGRCSCVRELPSHEADAFHFLIHAYCLMPDHLHFLARGLNFFDHVTSSL